MPGPKATAIKLTEQTAQELRRLENAYTTGQQIAKRSSIIRLAASGASNAAIAKAVGVNRQTVILWRQRWLFLEPIPLDELSVEERLEDLLRSGKPSVITADQRCQLEAIACQPPANYGRPISQWTGRELADEMVKQEIIVSLSPRHAGRLLKMCVNSSPQEPILAEYDQR